MDFKEYIEALRTTKILRRFPDNTNEWVNKFWYESAVKYTKGKTASQIEKNIIEMIKLMGHQAEKRSVSGRVIDNTKVVTDVLGRKRSIGSKTYIPSTSTKGSADISAVVYGCAVSIEVKKGKDIQSTHQKKYQEAITSAGGFYFIAKDEQDFLDKFLDLLEHPKIKLLSSL